MTSAPTTTSSDQGYDFATAYQKEQKHHQLSMDLARTLKTELPTLPRRLAERLTKEGYQGLTPSIMEQFIRGYFFELLSSHQDPVEKYFVVGQSGSMALQSETLSLLEESILRYYRNTVGLTET